MRAKLFFMINKYYLAAYSFYSRCEPFNGYLNKKYWFIDHVWTDKNEAFIFTPPRPEVLLFFDPDSKKNEILNNQGIIRSAYKEYFRTREFKRLLKETNIYKRQVQHGWIKNHDEVIGYMEDLSGLDLPNQKIDIIITHPKLRNGICLSKNTICFGHTEDWKNYSTVYLCHEILHIMTNLSSSRIMHAIIEAIADNEIRIRLNKRGRYFETESNNHYMLRKILPYWLKYLNDINRDNIIRLERKIKGAIGA